MPAYEISPGSGRRLATRALRVVLSALVVAACPAAALAVCGDVNGNGSLSSSDALSVLRAAVGQPVELQCVNELPETGQSTCATAAGGATACVGTGQDGEFKAGAARSFTDNGDGTITDNVTGLMWEKHSDDGSIHDKDSLHTWVNAAATKIAALNSESFAGHDDWRVPNLLELETLINYGAPAAGPTAFAAFQTACTNGCTVLGCSCTRAAPYWSSTHYKFAPGNAWFVTFNAGDPDANPTSTLSAVRGVRGGV